MVALGDTFWHDKTISPNGHLYVVLSDPTKDPERVVVANFTTREPGCDETCVVTKREHRWLSHDSVVAYQFAKHTTQRSLEFGIKAGLLKTHDRASPELVAKVAKGLLDSKVVPEVIKQTVRQHGPTPPPAPGSSPPGPAPGKKK